MKVNLEMKCPNCGHWNKFPVNKVFVEQPSSEPKAKVWVPMYETLHVL
jgi:phage FluMu protein Com